MKKSLKNINQNFLAFLSFIIMLSWFFVATHLIESDRYSLQAFMAGFFGFFFAGCLGTELELFDEEPIIKLNFLSIGYIAISAILIAILSQKLKQPLIYYFSL